MVTRPLVNVSLEANRALELWALPGSGAPRSLGLISASGATVVKKGKVLEGATGLAVSLEPAGGSPTGAPTGPVLYVGKLQICVSESRISSGLDNSPDSPEEI